MRVREGLVACHKALRAEERVSREITQRTQRN